MSDEKIVKIEPALFWNCRGLPVVRPASVGASPAHLPSAFLGYPEIARGTPGPMEEKDNKNEGKLLVTGS